MNNLGPFMRWNWSREPDSGLEVTELMSCLNLLYGCKLGLNADVWLWEADSSKRFSVKSARRLIGGQSDTSDRLGFVWNKWIPLKVNIFGWRLFLNRLPSKDALAARNIHIDSQLCPFCDEVTETLDHLFSACRFGNEVWAGVSSWLKIPPIFAFGYKDILLFHRSLRTSKRGSKLIQAILLISCWMIWKARNKLIFEKSKSSANGVIGEIKAVGFLWIKHRAKSLGINEINWSRFDLL
ncbi:uncharacterized protein LOC110914015 [Helianthus annuus]|uniref:uncharacterized protein LOC110914015 n=1 Tax=Helianthus annuus TaxID=4232 RepID=UPI000B8FE45E|nr:uncharacterized protein LOC110914015 [Helianthus annuus]